MVTGYQLDLLERNNSELQGVIVRNLKNNTCRVNAKIQLPFFWLEARTRKFDELGTKFITSPY